MFVGWMLPQLSPSPITLARYNEGIAAFLIWCRGSILLAFLLWAPLAFSLPTSLPVMRDWSRGKPIASAQRLTVLVFLSPVCPCSRAHESVLRGLQSKFSNVQFVGIYSGNDSVEESKAREHFQKAALGFPLVRDADLSLANRFEAMRTPHAFVLDPTGTVLYQGAVDDVRTGHAERLFLNDTLERLVQGKPLEVTETRPLGCRIER
jgi:hypothetical protein